jgi:MFS family permease
MVILGGAGTVWGPFLGAIIYTLAANVLSSWTQTWQIIIGATFVLCVLFFPKGILGIGAMLRSAQVEEVEDIPEEAIQRREPAVLVEGELL